MGLLNTQWVGGEQKLLHNLQSEGKMSRGKMLFHRLHAGEKREHVLVLQGEREEDTVLEGPCSRDRQCSQMICDPPSSSLDNKVEKLVYLRHILD